MYGIEKIPYTMSGQMMDMVMMLLLLGGGYLAYREGLFDELFSGGIGGGGGGTGGPISGGGSCVGTRLSLDKRPDREEYEIHNIPGNPSAYEVTWCGTIKNQAEDLTFKMYGPRHTGNGTQCCWCVMHVDKSGRMTPGGEGPHPEPNCTYPGGGSGPPAPCYKAVMRPGPIQEGYALVGGKWQLRARYKGPCGCPKEKGGRGSSSKTGNTLMVRIDKQSGGTKCASVRSLGGGLGTGGGGKAPAVRARQVIHTSPVDENRISIA